MDSWDQFTRRRQLEELEKSLVRAQGEEVLEKLKASESLQTMVPQTVDLSGLETELTIIRESYSNTHDSLVTIEGLVNGLMDEVLSMKEDLSKTEVVSTELQTIEESIRNLEEETKAHNNEQVLNEIDQVKTYQKDKFEYINDLIQYLYTDIRKLKMSLMYTIVGGAVVMMVAMLFLCTK